MVGLDDTAGASPTSTSLEIAKLGKNCTMEERRRAHPEPPRTCERVCDGLVQLREYHCAVRAGDPPEEEQFGRASIAIVRSGVFGVRSGRQSKLLTTGFQLLGNRGQTYETSHDHAGGDRCLVFDFHGTVVEELAESMRRGAGRRPFATNVLPPTPRAEAIWHLAEEHLRSGADAIGLEELGLSLAEQVIREVGSGTPRPAAHDDPRAREQVLAATARIEEYSNEELCLADLAKSTGQSQFQFIRQFKRETGVTPYRFLLQARIRQAIALLRDTSAPITGIAYDVGFGDLSNFINAFRREVGCSPREFRKSGLTGWQPGSASAARAHLQSRLRRDRADAWCR
jgi:AraC family transcriptional regulator